MSELAIPSFIFISALYVLILITGIWIAKKLVTKLNLQELFLSGRNVRTIVGSISIAVSMIAGKYASEIAEIVYNGGSFGNQHGGVIWCQIPIATAISLFLGGLIFAYPMRSNGYLTMLDPCTHKFGTIMGAILFAPLLINELIRIGSSLSFFGDVLFRHSFTNIGHAPIFLVCMGTAVISIAYCFMGGVKSLVYTDIAKFAVIFCGLWVFGPCALVNYNYVRCIRTTVDQWLGHLDAKDVGLFSDQYISLIISTVTWQGYFQRILSLQTAIQARTASLIAAVLCILIAIPSALIGTVGRSTDWNKTEIGHTPSDKESVFIFTIALQALTPPVIASIGIGVVAVSTIAAFDTSIIGISTMFTTNIFRSVIKPQASETEAIRCFKTAIIFTGIIGLALGCAVLPYRGFQILVTDLICTAVFPQLLCALFVQPCNGYGAFVAFFSTITLRLLSGEPRLNLPAVIQYPWYDASTHLQLFPFRTFLMLLSTVILITTSLMAEHLFMTTKSLPRKYDFLKVFNRPMPDLLSSATLPGTVQQRSSQWLANKRTPSMDNEMTSRTL